MRISRPSGAVIAMLAASLAVAFGLAEGYFRLVSPIRYGEAVGRFAAPAESLLLHRPSAVPGLLYELAPDSRKVLAGVPVITNSFGMRDAEPMDESAGPVARIAVLGDSFTFGDGVPAGQAYPSVLERLLGERHPEAVRFDVLNFGVEGYSTRDEALVLRHKALRWKPTHVVVGYVLNDPDVDPLQPLARHFQKRAWWQWSHVLRLIAMTRRNAAIRWYGSGDYVRALHADPRTWGTVEAGFADMKSASAGCDGVIVAIFPLIPRTGWDGYAYAELHDQVCRLARSDGFHVVDLLETWRQTPPHELIVSESNRHPNALAHEMAAEAIRALLEQEGLLERARQAHGADPSTGGS